MSSHQEEGGTAEDDVSKGVVFYLNREERKIVGVLTWNLFGKMDIARKVGGHRERQFHLPSKMEPSSICPAKWNWGCSGKLLGRMEPSSICPSKLLGRLELPREEGNLILMELGSIRPSKPITQSAIYMMSCVSRSLQMARQRGTSVRLLGTLTSSH